MRERCCRIVRAVYEVEEGPVRRWRRPHQLIREDDLAQLTVVVRAFRADARLLETRRFGDGVCIEDGTGKHGVPWPESVTDHFVRIRIAHELRTFARRRTSSGKTGHREIEAAPEEMDRAALAHERAARDGEDAGYVHEDLPKLIRGDRVIGVMLEVLIEPDRRRDLDWHRPDLHCQRHVAEESHQLAIELRDRNRSKTDD